MITPPAHLLTGLHLVRVCDPDTIIVAGPECGRLQPPVRLAWLDGPERGRPGFHAATRFLHLCCTDKSLSLTPRWHQGSCTDRWGRIVANVYAAGKDVTRLMIKAGWGTYWQLQGPAPTHETYIRTQAFACAQQLGLWNPHVANADPLPPDADTPRPQLACANCGEPVPFVPYDCPGCNQTLDRKDTNLAD